MIANDSNLSDSKFHYDIVAAITQNAVNALMKQHIDLLGPEYEQFLCYKEVNGQVVRVEYSDLLKATNGVDPFTVPNGVAPTDPRFEVLQKQGFVLGINAKMGLPPGWTQDWEVVSLEATEIFGPTPTRFRLSFSKLSVVIMETGHQPRYYNILQPSPGGWIWTYQKLPIELEHKLDSIANLGPEARGALPSNLPEQTEVYLTHAFLDLAKIPDVCEVFPEPLELPQDFRAYTILRDRFPKEYVGRLSKTHLPMLPTIVQAPSMDVAQSSLIPTRVHVGASIYTPSLGQPAQPGLNTLNYLMAVQGHALGLQHPFTWNWVEPSDNEIVHGVMAVKRDFFVRYFQSLLVRMFSEVPTDAREGISRDFNDPVMGWTEHPEGTTLGALHQNVYYNYEGAPDKIVSARYDVMVDIFGTNEIYFSMNMYRSGGDRRPIGLSVQFVLTIEIDHDGKIRAVSNYSEVSKYYESHPLHLELGNDYLHRMLDVFFKWGEELTYLLNSAAPFVMPEGQVFSFSSVGFSTHQDLVAGILYIT